MSKMSIITKEMGKGFALTENNCKIIYTNTLDTYTKYLNFIKDYSEEIESNENDNKDLIKEKYFEDLITEYNYLRKSIFEDNSKEFDEEEFYYISIKIQIELQENINLLLKSFENNNTLYVIKNEILRKRNNVHELVNESMNDINQFKNSLNAKIANFRVLLKGIDDELKLKNIDNEFNRIEKIESIEERLNEYMELKKYYIKLYKRADLIDDDIFEMMD